MGNCDSLPVWYILSLSLVLVLLFVAVQGLLAPGPCIAATDLKTTQTTQTTQTTRTTRTTGTTQVLYINSYHPGYEWSDGIQSGLLNRLKSSGRKIEVSVECLDSRRFVDPALLKKLADIMLAKYAGYRLDMVIVSDNAAYDFAIRNRARLFPGIPIVFCGYNAFRPVVLDGLHDITGVNEELDIVGLIEQAQFIQPALRTLVFILSTGDLSSKSIAHEVESSIIPRYKDQFEIIVLKDAPMRRIRATLAGLQPETALFLIGQTSDLGQGRALSPIENGQLIAAASPVPVYTLWDFHLNTGVLGGIILSGQDQGRAAADIALRIMNGENADAIPVLMQSPVRNIYDYTVMKHFGLSIADLPKDSFVINKPNSLFEEHKRIVWGTLGIFMALVIFIFILAINILRRVRAEKVLQTYQEHLEQLVEARTAELSDLNKALTDSKERFRSLSDAAFEGIVFSENGILIDGNTTSSDIFGYSPPELLKKEAIDLIAPEERENVRNKMMSGYGQPYETLGVKKDSTTFPIEICGKMYTYKGRQVRVSAVRDLTEKKKAEEEIKTLRGILPFCSHCKKVRDDKGYWEQVEIYLHKYSEADISHGICPECAIKLYPEHYPKK